MTVSRVEFQGQGPFQVGLAHRAEATASTDAVEIALYAIVGDDPEPRPIYFQMAPLVASKLAHRLTALSIEIEERKS